MTKPNLLLVPGLLCTDALFAPQIEALSVKATIAVADHTHHDNIADMAAAMLNEAPHRFALVGLSMGGYIAFELIRQAPERIERLALLDTNARADRPQQAADRREFVALAETQGLHAVSKAFVPLMVHPDRLSDEQLVGTIEQMVRDTGFETFERQQEAIISRPDNRPFLPEIRCSTLVIVGEQDAVAPPKVSHEMAAAIPDARIEVIPDCGHLTTLERPETVTTLLAEWLDL